MQVELIGEYELTYQADGDPALVAHHLIRGRDVLALDAAATSELRALLVEEQKRIRRLGGYQLILGSGGDLTFYDTAGQRACYLNGDQARKLGRMLREGREER
jgi:hypothetical protein